MGSFRVVSEGPLTRPLSGTVHVGGAKNSALKLMAASLLAPGRTVIHNVPNILDVAVMGQLLRQLGCTVEIAYPGHADPSREPTAGRATIEVPEELDHKAPYELVRRLRASIAVLGPLVARCRRASVALPGGDAIGSRGLDMHILGLQELGAVVRIEHGQVVAEVPEGLQGANLWLDFPSVGATENLVMAAVLARRHHGHRQRRPRAGDHRPVRDARGDGCPDRRHLDVDPGHRGRRPAQPGRAHHGDRPDRRRAPGSSPAPSPVATCTSAAAWPTTSTSCSTSSWRPGPRSSRARPASRVHTHSRLSVVRRRHVALPRLPDRPAAVRDGARLGLVRAPR